MIKPCFLMFTAVVFVKGFTATVTASLTVHANSKVAFRNENGLTWEKKILPRSQVAPRQIISAKNTQATRKWIVLKLPMI
jgi:hypothetical protein